MNLTFSWHTSNLSSLTLWNTLVTVSQSWFCLDRVHPAKLVIGRITRTIVRSYRTGTQNRFLGLSAFSLGGDRRSQIRKKNTWALKGVDCHHSPTHSIQKKIKNIWILQKPSSQTSFARRCSCRARFQRHYGFKRWGTVFLVLKQKYWLQMTIVIPH
jgi:hypothetical protein